MADGKAPVCAAGGAPVTKQYIYSLYDAKTGALRAKGTPQELMEQGYYNRAESVCTGYAHQKKKKAKPKKWRLEREEKQPKPKAEPDHRTGTQMREVWFYSMFDADGNLLHEGTAAELVEKGLFKNTQTVTNVFYAGHCRPQGIYSLTRKRIRRGVLRNAPGARSSVPKKSRPPITGIEKPDELQRDVHELCLYNAAARKAGKKRAELRLLGLQKENRRHRHDHMVLQTRLSGKAPGVPWDVRKVQGMGGCGESRKSLHKGHGIPGQSEPERLRKGRLDGAQRTAQTKKITEEAPGKRMPGLWRQRSRIKSAGCCRSVPAAGGSLYTIYFIAG